MIKTIFYTTLENQVRDNGSKGLLYDHFEDLNAALAKYYTICAAAAVSELPYHSAAILRDDGAIIKEEVFDRRVEEEPEEETEPESAGE